MNQKSNELIVNENITLIWLGHASFKIKTPQKTIYIDPFQLKEEEQADIILITHAHYDHCSVNDVKKIIKPQTMILAPQECITKFEGMVKIQNLVAVAPNKNYAIDKTNVSTIPAYNVSKEFHPKNNAWVGYIINIDGLKIYHAGDTDFIPEMKGLDVDIALLPVGGTYTMDAKEAAAATDAIKPKMYAIPMHYKTIVGSETNAYEFKQKTTQNVKIL